jgi:sugar porter (SP) family MFS transporter
MMGGFLQEATRGRNTFILRVAIIAALGGLLFGYDTGVISGALLFIRKDLQAGQFAQQWIVASLLVGAVIGAVISGWSADALSRRWTKVVSGSVYVLGALGSAFAQNVPQLVAARFVLGLSVGTASFVSPMYISEQTPPRLRGGTVSFNQLMITGGIFLAYIADWALKGIGPGNWRWMLGLGALPGLALALGMAFLVPHSPRWLVEKDREEEARDVLEDTREGDVGDELDQIREVSQQQGQVRVRDLLARGLRPMLVVGLGLAIFQQIVGVNTVIYFAPTILSYTGLDAGSAVTQALIVGLTNVVFTVVAILLLDRIGRRPLLVIGTAGLTVALALLGAFFAFPSWQQSAPWLALAALVLYIAAFAVGLGPVFWLMISEIYPLRIRSTAMALATVANWTFNFLVSYFFLSLVGWIGKAGTFWLYAAIGVAAVLFFWWRVPETKGRSLEEIERDLGVQEQAAAGS